MENAELIAAIRANEQLAHDARYAANHNELSGLAGIINCAQGHNLFAPVENRIIFAVLDAFRDPAGTQN